MEQKLLYKSPNHLANLNDLRLAEKLCDVTIKADDKEVRAHKLILAAKLKYFDTMFLSSFQESKQEVITMEGMEGANLEAFITFAYTGEILLTDRNVLGLLEVANYLGEGGIKEACIGFLEKHLKKEDACRAYKFADAVNCLSLKTVAKKMILSNFNSCSHTADYLDLDFENIKEILSNASSNFANTQHICFESAMRWIVHDARHRKMYNNELLNLIDMNKLDTDYLLEYFCKNIGDQDYSDVTKDVMSYYREKNQHMKSRTKHHADKLDEELRKNSAIYRLMIIGGILKKLHFQLYDPAKMLDKDSSIRIPILHKHMWKILLEKWSDPLEITHLDKHMDEYRWNCGAILDNKFYYTISNWRFKCLQAFDPVTKQTTTISSESSLLRYTAVCSANNCIYFCGGLNDDKTTSNQLLKYDPLTNSFETLTPMRIKRSSVTAIYHEGQLYVLGGKDEELQVMNAQILGGLHRVTIRPFGNIFNNAYVMRLRSCKIDWKFRASCDNDKVEQYSIKTDTWIQLPSMSQPRASMEVKVLNNKLYVCGGWPRSVVEVYDLSTKEWHLAANMKHWRSDFLMLVQTDGLLVIGGNKKNTAEEYDPSKDEWKIVPGITSGLKIPYGTGGWISLLSCNRDVN